MRTLPRPAMRVARRGLVVATALAAFLPASTASARPAAWQRTAQVPWQLITVTAKSHTTTYATLRAYQVSGRKRVLVFGPWTARVGYNGVAWPGKKREGDGKTPAGSYRFSFFFGVKRKLAFAYPFRHAYTYDYWDDDPSSARYNEWIDARKQNPGANPEPMHQVPAYDYAAVIAYNTARTPGLGSAIFLHVGTGGPTAGCVSLPAPRLVKILRWLKPKDHPRITISG
jgi:L,D-peptidoglycan transpeptidase YkuD (ErfK/YbiS/YcfS/YnhG family)